MHFHCIHLAAQVSVHAWELYKAEVAKGSGSTSFELYSGFFSPKMRLPQLFCLQHLPNNFCDSCFVSTWLRPSTLVILVTLQLTWLPCFFIPETRLNLHHFSLLTCRVLPYPHPQIMLRRVTVNCCSLLCYLDFSLCVIYSSHCKKNSPHNTWTKTTLLPDGPGNGIGILHLFVSENPGGRWEGRNWRAEKHCSPKDNRSVTLEGRCHLPCHSHAFAVKRHSATRKLMQNKQCLCTPPQHSREAEEDAATSHASLTSLSAKLC